MASVAVCTALQASRHRLIVALAFLIAECVLLDSLSLRARLMTHLGLSYYAQHVLQGNTRILTATLESASRALMALLLPMKGHRHALFVQLTPLQILLDSLSACIADLLARLLVCVEH